MPASRLVLRWATAGVAFVLVTSGMLIGTAMLALAIDWDIPEGERELQGPSSVFDRDGRPIARFAAEIESRPVDLDRMDESLHHAIVAAEDHRFYEHEGVDPFSVVRAVVRNVTTGAIAEGGSTLTQQYVKNVYVGSDPTFSRKVREAVVALQLEKERTKEQILEDYLNYVYFGEGAYGAQAAAITYFDKPASELSIAESALLASTVTAPARFSPRDDPGGARLRRNRVLDQMARSGFITRSEASTAKDEPLELQERETGPSPAPFFIERVRREMLEAYGPEKVYNGGLHIITTLDIEQHRTVQERVREQMPDDPSLDMGAVALDPTNGDVLGTYSGRDFDESQVDLAMGSDFGQQSGSAFKPVVLATALEEGKKLSSVYPSGRVTVGDTTVTGAYCGGACSLAQATAVSDNTVYFRLGRDVGQEDFVRMAYRLGMRSPDLNDDRHGIGLALGTGSVTPLDMASAFGTFSNKGVACPARTVREVRNPAGPALKPPDPRQPSEEQRQEWARRLKDLGYAFGDEDLGRCYRALPPSVAGQVTEALQGVVAGGTGSEADIGRPQAGKTGTSQENQELWFAGYTPKLSLAMYLGHPDTRAPIKLPSCGNSCFGGNVMAPRWAHVAGALLEDVEPGEFSFPEPGTHKRPQQRRLGPASPTGDPEEPSEEEDNPGLRETDTTRPGDSPTGTGQSPTAPSDSGPSAPSDTAPGQSGSGHPDPEEYEGLESNDDPGSQDPMDYEGNAPEGGQQPSDDSIEPDPGDGTGGDNSGDGGLLLP